MATAEETGTTTAAPLLDKILSRFRILRRGNAGGNTLTGGSAGNAPPPPPQPPPPPDSSPGTASASNTYTEPGDADERKFKVTDLLAFCTLINRFLGYIQTTTEFSQLISSYPSKHQNLLDSQIKELHAIQMEARAAYVRITQLKNQRKAVQRECKMMVKSLESMKEEEIKEMENYIAHYDKSLMSRWEKIRSSSEKDTVESFLHDLKGKQKALDYLHKLATSKLNLLHNTSQPSTTQELKPMSLALRRLSANSGTRGSSCRWRSKHHERAIKTLPPSTNQDVNSTPLVPQAAPFSLTISSTNSSGGSSRTSWASALESTSNRLIQPNSPTTGSTNIATSPAVSNSPERRSILQALFNDIQHVGTHDNLPINAVVPHLVATNSLATTGASGSGRTEGQIINSSSNNPNGNDIELFTINHQS